jgi:hypothetical protein
LPDSGKGDCTGSSSATAEKGDCSAEGKPKGLFVATSSPAKENGEALLSALKGESKVDVGELMTQKNDYV